jgi:thymidine kinase
MCSAKVTLGRAAVLATLCITVGNGMRPLGSDSRGRSPCTSPLGKEREVARQDSLRPRAPLYPVFGDDEPGDDEPGDRPDPFLMCVVGGPPRNPPDLEQQLRHEYERTCRQNAVDFLFPLLVDPDRGLGFVDPQIAQLYGSGFGTPLSDLELWTIPLLDQRVANRLLCALRLIAGNQLRGYPSNVNIPALLVCHALVPESRICQVNGRLVLESGRVLYALPLHTIGDNGAPIQLVMGPMTGGKSAWLVRGALRLIADGHGVVCLTSRFSSHPQELFTRAGSPPIPAIPIPRDEADTGWELRFRMQLTALRALGRLIHVVADEFHFLTPRQVDTVIGIALEFGARIMMAGLDLDSDGRAWLGTLRALQHAVRVSPGGITHLFARCIHCDGLAGHTVRFDKYGRPLRGQAQFYPDGSADVVYGVACTDHRSDPLPQGAEGGPDHE